MTFEELLKSCSGGLPKVVIPAPLKKGCSNVGKVTVIKDAEGFQGCAVRFGGMQWDTWFHAKHASDKRSRYISELTLLEAIKEAGE